MSRKQLLLIDRLLAKLFPGVKKNVLMEFLWGATAFPFAGYETLRKQIIESHKKGGGTVKGALEWSHKDLDRRMKEYGMA